MLLTRNLLNILKNIRIAGYLFLCATLLGADMPAFCQTDFSQLPLTGCHKVTKDAKVCEQRVEVASKEKPYEWIKSRLEPGRIIDIPVAAQLEYKTGLVFAKSVKTRDLARKVPEWLGLEFDSPKGENAWMRSTGDMLAYFHAMAQEPDKTRQGLQQLKTNFPDIWKAVESFLPNWVNDRYLYANTWDPNQKGENTDENQDGILELPPFAYSPGNAKRLIYQACAPIYASFEDIMRAENDFTNYPRQHGVNYIAVYALPDHAFYGKDEHNNPVLLYDVFFHQKPLPLVQIRFTLRQYLCRIENRLQLINSLVSGDMNYFRSRIFYDPIVTSNGMVIGYIKTEYLDIDVKGVPEGDEDRIAGLRIDIGNIKRMAENKL